MRASASFYAAIFVFHLIESASAALETMFYKTAQLTLLSAISYEVGQPT